MADIAKNRPGDCAALDFGTNSVLLLLARDDGVGISQVAEWCAITRLGEGAGRNGMLRARPMDRTITAASGFLDRFREHSPAGIGVAAATSAVRDAPNREEFLTECKTRLGWMPLVLTGDQEAETTFLGAAADRSADQMVITVDVGGGSTEIGAGFPGHCLHRNSLDLGCVRFGERFGLYESPGREAVDAACREADDLLRAAVARLRNAVGPEVVRAAIVAGGGTATTYSAWRQGLEPYDRNRAHGFRDARSTLTESARQLLQLPLTKRRELSGVSHERALVLPTGLLILDRVLGALGADGFQVTTRGLHYGLVLQLRAGKVPPVWHW